MSTPTSDQLFAPFVINLLTVDSSSVDIRVSDWKAGDTIRALDQTIGFPITEPYYGCEASDDGLTYRVAAKLPVIIFCRRSEGDDPIAQYSAHGMASYTFPKPEKLPEEREGEYRAYMKANAVSILYSHLRGVIQDLSEKTPLGPVILPPINPSKLLLALDAELENYVRNESAKE